MKPIVSIVIVNYGSNDLTETCLKSVLNSKLSTIQIILINNGDSTVSDNIKNMVTLLIRTRKNVGYGSACNLAARFATGKYILFLNNDVVLKEETMSAFVDVMEKDKTIGACGAALVNAKDVSKIDSLGVYLNQFGFFHHIGDSERADRYPKEFCILAPKGAALIVRADVFRKLDGFDPDFFFYVEETDLCWRIWLCGLKVLYVPRAVVYHVGGRTVNSLDPLQIKKLVYYHGFKNRLHALAKNLEIRTFLFILPRHLLLCVGVGLWHTAKGDALPLLYIARAIWWNIRFVGKLIAKKRRLNTIRRVCDRELLPLLTRKDNLSDLLRLIKAR